MKLSFLSGQVKLASMHEANVFLCASINPRTTLDRIKPLEAGPWHVGQISEYYLVENEEMHNLFDDMKGWYVSVIRLPLEFDRESGEIKEGGMLGDYGNVLTQDGYLLTLGTPAASEQYGGPAGYLKHKYEEARAQ